MNSFWLYRTTQQGNKKKIYEGKIFQILFGIDIYVETMHITTSYLHNISLAFNFLEFNDITSKK